MIFFTPVIVKYTRDISKDIRYLINEIGASRFGILQICAKIGFIDGGVFLFFALTTSSTLLTLLFYLLYFSILSLLYSLFNSTYMYKEGFSPLSTLELTIRRGLSYSTLRRVFAVQHTSKIAYKSSSQMGESYLKDKLLQCITSQLQCIKCSSLCLWIHTTQD